MHGHKKQKMKLPFAFYHFLSTVLLLCSTVVALLLFYCSVVEDIKSFQYGKSLLSLLFGTPHGYLDL